MNSNDLVTTTRITPWPNSSDYPSEPQINSTSIGRMLTALESEGFHIYYCDENKNWEFINQNEDIEYRPSGADKDRLIIQVWEVVFKN